MLSINKYIDDLFHFFITLYTNRKLLISLVTNNFKKQYLGSYFGLFWAYIQPLTYIVVIWFVFNYGFKRGDFPDGTPFFLWLISGIIPWFFLSATLSSTTNAIIENSFLVKKVAFRVSILPLVPIGSSLIIHLGLLFVLLIAFLLYGYSPTIYWFQLIYYLFCSVFILLGIGWITSSIRVFVKDVSNFIAVLIQIGFWATPIFWQLSSIPEKYQWIIKLNPAEYIVSGYRDTFINNTWFFEKPYETVYFWLLSSLLFIFGAWLFRKLRPHFGDVL